MLQAHSSSTTAASALAPPPGSGVGGSKQHDASQLRIRAEVDFIQVDVFLARRTSGFHVKQTALATFAEALDAGSGNAATVFRVRIDDPAHWEEVQDMLSAIEARFGFVIPPRMHKLEVAIDAYLDPALSSRLTEITERMFRFSKYVCSNNLRLGRSTGEVVSAEFSPVLLAGKLAQGFTLYVGNREDDVTQRYYCKTTDRSGRVKLPSAEHRARMELTLQGGALPFVDLGKARGFRFQSLAKRFKLQRVKKSASDLGPLGQLVLQRQVILGARKSSGRRLQHPNTEADIWFNERSYDALRNLTARMRVRPLAARRTARQQKIR
jgi:hypothetical protein